MHPLIDQGLTLALYGMSTVFFLLTVLVFAVIAMSLILKKVKYSDENSSELGISLNKRAAIVGAIVQHRKNKSPKVKNT